MNRPFRSLQFFRPDWPRMVVVGWLMLASVGANLLKPWPLALMVDSALGGKPLPEWARALAGEPGRWGMIAVLTGALLLVHVAHGVLSALQNYVSIKVGLRGLTRVRNEVFACLQRLSLRFHQGSKSGDLIFRASWDTYSFQTLFQQGAVMLASATLSLVLMVLVMWRVNVKLTLVALAVVPPLVAVIKIFGRRMRERGTLAQQADSQVTSLVQQSIAALPLIQSYTREKHEEARFGEQSAVAEQRRLAQHGCELFYWLAITLTFAAGTAMIVWLGATEVLARRLTIGELLVFLAYLAQLYDPLNQLSHVGATLAGATAATRRVFELLDAPEEVKDAPNARRVQSPDSTAHDPKALVVRGALAVRAVTFGYQKSPLVLHNVSFELHPGESCAVVGPSGAGKSTLIHLVPRFFDPDSGAVLLDGVNVRDIRLKDLRLQMALMMQDPILLPATIAENISYGKPGASQAEIERAARCANAHEFIARLPDAYHTIVGEGAARLSMGERQRINMARAFLKDAPVLLLDEPTSALDAESESKVASSIFDLMRGRTALIVAHRPGTIRRVDKVLVLEAGRVTAFGSPDELLARDGYFARVMKGQIAAG